MAELLRRSLGRLSLPSLATVEAKEYWLVVLVCVAYMLTARLGLSIHPVNTYATLIWPPAGIALSTMILFGYRVWPAIALGAFVVNYVVGGSILVSVCIAIGNTLEAYAAAYFLNRIVGFNRAVLRLRDNVGLVAVSFFATMISATIGVSVLAVLQGLPEATYWQTWFTWWTGDMLGILIIAPVVLKWLSKPLFARTRAQYVELLAVLVVVTATASFLFWSDTSGAHVYYIFLPLAWAALRTGPRGTTLSVFIISAIAIGGTVAGRGAFASDGLVPLQIYLASTACLYLIFAAIVEDRRRISETLRSHVTELEHTLRKISSEDEAKNEFIAMLAHELRNPLAAILSSVELLKVRDIERTESEELLSTVDKRARTMGNLLDDLLDVSRISQRKLKLSKKPVSLSYAMDQAVITTQPFISARNHSFSVTKPSQEIVLDADPVRLEQIFVNLLMNAAKYTDPGGSISFVAERDGDQAILRVRDNGIGISENVLARIYDPFFQVTGVRRTEGLGIGLALTRQLIELHGGSIETRSKEGTGSEFTVRLPIVAKTVTHLPDRKVLNANASLRSAKHSLSILLVDDNQAAADALGRLLTMRGHSVTVVYSGKEAVEKADELQPYVIILDIGLPDIDGYDAARIIREKNIPAYIVALTGYGQSEDKERAYAAGFNYHLTKPVGLKEVEAVLRKANSEQKTIAQKNLKITRK